MSKAERAETQKINFTKGMLERLKAPAEGRMLIYDAQVSGLGIQVMPTGKKTFFWFRFVHGAPLWRALGEWPALSLEDARGAAGEKNTLRERWKASGYAGPSPFARASSALTLQALADAYIEQHLREHAKRPEKAEKELRRWIIDGHLADWKDRPLEEITPERVAALHRQIGAKYHRMANRVVKELRSLFRFADRAHLWKGELPTKGIRYFHEPKRARFLQPDELSKLWAALRKAPNLDLQHYVNLALWTGARKSDVLSMRWQDVSLDDNRWTIPDPKSRTPYVVPLTPEAINILKARMRLRIEGDDFVFPSRGKTGHVVDLKGAWKKLLQAAGLHFPNSELRITQHDLRRTQGSWQAGLGTSLLVIGKSLGHQSQSATQIYSRLDLDPVRQAMTESNKAMRTAMRKKVKAAPVVKLLKPAPRPKVAARG